MNPADMPARAAGVAHSTTTGTETSPERTQAAELQSSPPQLRFIHEHQTCAMCEGDLEIAHEINKTELKVKEQAHCPSCGIRVRSAQHLMH